MALLVPANQYDLKRTCQPLYEHHQATAHAVTYDGTGVAVDIYPGMVATKLEGEVVTLSDGTVGNKAFGLFCHFLAPSIGVNEVTGAYGATAVWRGGPDAVFEVSAPAIDDTKSFVDPGDGTELLIVPGSGAINRGKLCPAGVSAVVGYEVAADADACAKLISASADGKSIVIQLFI